MSLVKDNIVNRLVEFSILNKGGDIVLDYNGVDGLFEVEDTGRTHLAREIETDYDGSTVDNEDRVKVLEKMRADIQARKIKNILASVRDFLFTDPYIRDTATALKIPGDKIISWDEQGRLVFPLKTAFFKDWKVRHQNTIGADSNPHEKPRK
ncbi:MAG: hypothetical protein J3R72DRAFT_477004 [Linnemannia gamsii]|nr:MAG: hypothetical protein J3R72DRAFT_477004 [Linnemannia gamsii]